MKRTLILAFALVGLGLTQVANAATVTVTASDTTPMTGQTITLEVRVTVAPGDGTDGSLFGALVFPQTGVALPPTLPTQFAYQGSTGTPYGLGALSCTTARCVVFNQTSGTQGPQPGDVTNFLIATQTYTVTAPAGTVLTWQWQTTPTTQALSFYNATPPVPALRVTVIPEPTTAAMLGLGLLGLAMAGRRRA